MGSTDVAKKEEKSPRRRNRDRSRSTKKKSKKSHKKSSKKARKRERTVSLSSSADDSLDEFEEDLRSAQKLQTQREEAKERKRVAKERMKMNETPEEKRARRLEKHLRKEQKKKNELGWGDEYLGYSNVDNPFNDDKLTDTFVWGKKLSKEGIKTIDVADLKLQTRQRIVENKKELEYFKKMREEREQDREERDLQAREQEQAQYSEWSRQEDKFHLTQAKLRSAIRVTEKRAKVIDVLAKYIGQVDEEGKKEEVDDSAIVHPCEHLVGLGRRDLEDLLADINVYRNLEIMAANNDKLEEEEGDAVERDPSIDDFWRDMIVVAEDQLGKLDRQRESAMVTDRRDGVHGAVKDEVNNIFKGKSHPQLALLETQINQRIKSRSAGVDVGYWESLLGQLTTHMARARLDDRHQAMMKDKLHALKRLQQMEIKMEAQEDVDDEDKGEVEIEETRETPEEHKKEQQEGDTYVEPELMWSKLTATERVEHVHDLYESGGYSPSYASREELPPVIVVVEGDSEELRRLTQQKELKFGSTSSGMSSMEAKAREGMSKDEAVFSVEAQLENVSYLWSDKYKPRKPRYFNRVHTGFEWNKYNQTHYDLDNPPPKIVQGYRFNIFYPDLLDTTVSPKFAMYQCDDKDFAIIRFTAGPPYEDLAFKVVNRDWEANHKCGYRCQFQNGIFQLWFHFKRWRYRR